MVIWCITDNLGYHADNLGYHLENLGYRMDDAESLIWLDVFLKQAMGMRMIKTCKTHTCVQTSCTKILSTPGCFQIFKQPLTMQHRSTMMQPATRWVSFQHNKPQGKNNWLLVPRVEVVFLLKQSLSSQDSVRKKNWRKKGIWSSHSHDKTACFHCRGSSCRIFTKMISDSSDSTFTLNTINIWNLPAAALQDLPALKALPLELSKFAATPSQVTWSATSCWCQWKMVCWRAE